MKAALITDTHWTFKKSSTLFQEYFEKFYSEIFFPTLKKEKIDTVIHLGDAFDNRKSIDFFGLDWTQRVILEPLSDYTVHMITGNHDVFFRSSNHINSPSLLLQNYSNIYTYSEPTEIQLGGLQILFIPWINSENEEKTLNMIRNTNAQVVMGHLELNGFRVNSTTTMESGLNSDIFNKFKKVFSGHFHTRSDNGKVYYIGNPYEMFWSDVNDKRGFHIFDTDTLQHTPINNLNRLFYNIYYEDTEYQAFDTREYKNKIVKIIVRKKTDPRKFEKFVEKLSNSNIAELKVVENFQSQDIEIEEDFESENTISILNRYINESEVNLDKSKLCQILQEIYQEANEID